VLTLADLYGPGVVYNPRTSWDGHHMLRRGDDSVRDVMSGTVVTYSGRAELVCARAALPAAMRELAGIAGISCSETPLFYNTAEEFASVLRSAIERGNRIAFQHVHPPGAFPESAYCVPRELLIRLNDKANLPDWAPDGSFPARRVVSMEEAAGWPIEPGKRVVFKGSTARSTGAGGAVVIASTPDDVRSMPEQLEGCSRIVVESFEPFARTMCVTWAADQNGKVTYVGSADQVVTPEGAYSGSWVGPDFPVPEPALVIGEEIMRRAAHAGYVGFAGFDMGLLPDGRVLVFDLNFRLCASTGILLWYPEIRDRNGPDTHARALSITTSLPYAAMVDLAREAVRQGILWPLGCFDPALSVWSGRKPALRGAVVGRNRAETEARCEALRRLGLSFA